MKKVEERCLTAQRTGCLGWIFGLSTLLNKHNKPVSAITKMDLVQPLNPRAGILRQGKSANEAGELNFTRWKRKLLKRKQKEDRVKKAREKERRMKVV